MADFAVELELESQQVAYGATPVLLGGLKAGASCAPYVALSLYDGASNELIGRPCVPVCAPAAAGAMLGWAALGADFPCKVSPQTGRWPLDPGTYLLVAQAWTEGSNAIDSEVTVKFEVLPPPPPPEE